MKCVVAVAAAAVMRVCGLRFVVGSGVIWYQVHEADLVLGAQACYLFSGTFSALRWWWRPVLLWVGLIGPPIGLRVGRRVGLRVGRRMGRRMGLWVGG